MAKQWKMLISILLGIILGLISYVMVTLSPRRQQLTTAPPSASEAAEAPDLTATAEDLPIREPVLE